MLGNLEHIQFVCTIHQNAVLVVHAIDWDVTYRDLIRKIVSDSTNRECMLRRCENCPGNKALRTFLNEELTLTKMKNFTICSAKQLI